MTDHVKNKLTKLETIFKIQEKALLLLTIKGEHKNNHHEDFSTLTLKENGLLIKLVTEKFILIDVFEQLRIRPKVLKNRPFKLDIQTSQEKVFNLYWDLAGARRLTKFKKGPWEAKLQNLYDHSRNENEDFKHMLLLAANSSLVEQI